MKKFLQYLTNEQEKEGQKELGETPRNGTASGRRGSLQLSNRPSLQKRDTLTNGSFYPDQFEGRGNSSGMFNIVRSGPQPSMKASGKRPTTSGSQAPPRSASSRKPSGIKRGATQPTINRRNEYFEIPTNRSGVFGEVVLPPPQNQNKENQPAPQQDANTNHQATPPPSFNTRPQSNRPGTRGQWSRPGTMQSGRSYSRIPTRDGFNRSKTQGNFLPKRNPSAEKFKFSANLQNVRDDEIGQIEPPRTAQSVRPQDDAITPRYPSANQQYHQQQQQHPQDQQQQQPQQPPQQYQLPPQYQPQQPQQSQQPQQHNYRVDIPPTPLHEQPMDDGESSHRPVQYSKAFPGRRYQPSQIVFH